ncbi:MAG: caspase family protein, partial [Thermoplasmatota archaeon]
DARQLYNSLRTAGLLHPASVLLTNAEATSKNVRDAFARAAAAAGPNDTFLFFFSGHGDQVDVPVSAAELDLLDGETTSLANDADITAHANATTGVHGVGAGNVVGTTLTQTLTNKTLTSPVISTIVIWPFVSAPVALTTARPADHQSASPSSPGTATGPSGGACVVSWVISPPRLG